MTPNFLIIALSAFVPIIFGFIWYHPKVMGGAWMKAAGLNMESMKGANMILIFGLTFLFSFFLAMALTFMVIHQFSLYSILADEPGLSDPTSKAGGLLKTMLAEYGGTFRTFKHGAFHGTLAGIELALPIIGINAMFERKGAKYVMINTAFWTICMALMGGIICQFS